VLAGLAVLAISMSERGDAAFPGSNGKIAYSYGSSAYQNSIWAVGPDGSSPSQLTSGTADWNPAYSADGQRIAFERENGVMVMNADGSGLTQLAAGGYSNSSTGPNYKENYENPNTKENIPLVRIQSYSETWHGYGSPSFSPDGSQLAVSKSGGTFSNKIICEVESEGQECLNYGYGGYGGYGGGGGYFHSEAKCTGCTSHIVTLSSSTGAVTGEVTPASSSSTVEDFSPAYAPDGKLAFARWSYGGSSGIYVVNSPGATPSRVTSGSFDHTPDFSPDSSRIVFVRGHEFGLVGAGGGPVALLAALPLPAGAQQNHTSLESPAFSPDGSRLTFARTVFGSGGFDRGIFTMGVDGSGLAKVTNGGFGPNWQASFPAPSGAPPAAAPKRPKGKARKGKIRLSRKNEAVIGTITCGSTPCRLKVLSSKLKLKTTKKKGKKKNRRAAHLSTLEFAKKGKRAKKGRKGKKTSCSPRIKVAKRLAPGKRAKVKVKVSGRCLAGLKRARKARLVARIRVTDALGKKVVTLRSTLLSPKSKKPKGKRHKKRR